MIPLRFLVMKNIRVGGLWTQVRCSSQKNNDSSSSDSSSSSDEDEPKVTKKEDINKKLHELLQSMSTENMRSSTKASNLTLSRPQPKTKVKPLTVTKRVAATLGLDLVKAAANVAASIPSVDEKKLQDDLLLQIAKAGSSMKAVTQPSQQQEQPTTGIENLAPSKPSVNLSDLIVGMKIEQQSPVNVEHASRAQQVKSLIKSATHPRKERIQRPSPSKQLSESGSRAGLNEGVPFGIFKNVSYQVIQEDELSLWSSLNQLEIKLCVTHPPSNYFEELISWTDQGKLWKFPIDNMQGLEQESEVPFTEHVFLEGHLEEWCPDKGPIRQFMEVVCVALSKNPYLSVQEKQEHIEWYRNYFDKHQILLKETGALG